MKQRRARGKASLSRTKRTSVYDESSSMYSPSTTIVSTCCNRFLRRSQLNGSQGEVTGTDDFKNRRVSTDARQNNAIARLTAMVSKLTTKKPKKVKSARKVSKKPRASRGRHPHAQTICDYIRPTDAPVRGLLDAVPTQPAIHTATLSCTPGSSQIALYMLVCDVRTTGLALVCYTGLASAFTGAKSSFAVAPAGVTYSSTSFRDALYTDAQLVAQDPISSKTNTIHVSFRFSGQESNIGGEFRFYPDPTRHLFSDTELGGAVGTGTLDLVTIYNRVYNLSKSVKGQISGSRTFSYSIPFPTAQLHAGGVVPNLTSLLSKSRQAFSTYYGTTSLSHYHPIGFLVCDAIASSRYTLSIEQHQEYHSDTLASVSTPSSVNVMAATALDSVLHGVHSHAGSQPVKHHSGGFANFVKGAMKAEHIAAAIAGNPAVEEGLAMAVAL